MFVPACPCPVVLSLVAPDLAEDQVCPLFGQRQKLWACCPGTFPASGTCVHVCVCARAHAHRQALTPAVPLEIHWLVMASGTLVLVLYALDLSFPICPLDGLGW